MELSRLSGPPTFTIADRVSLLDESGNPTPNPSLGEGASLDLSSYAFSYEGGGFGPGYTSAPPTEPNGGGAGGGVIATAQQLNTGLTFQNGQWTVKQ